MSELIAENGFLQRRNTHLEANIDLLEQGMDLLREEKQWINRELREMRKTFEQTEHDRDRYRLLWETLRDATDEQRLEQTPRQAAEEGRSGHTIEVGSSRFPVRS
jgi:chromosome segregation ATPase